jgi:ArsR family transcriptional regulator
MTTSATTHLTTLADSTRGRLLLLLERTELTVGELCVIVQLPQSTVSRHLRVLSDEGWVTSRADGTSRYYRMAASLDEWTGRLWAIVREDIQSSAAARQDEVREGAVTADRRRRSREYFSSVAGQWDQVRADLFGARIDLHLALALIDPSATVGDLGCGSGHFTELLAPHVARVIAVDGSVEMSDAARRRLADRTNVDVRHGDLEQLPIEDGTLDLAVLALVLHYVSEPERVVVEARRVLKPSGRLIVIDMLPHEREDLVATMGQVWPGFSESQMGSWLGAAGFGDVRVRPLPPDADARGPAVFLASGVRSAA